MPLKAATCLFSFGFGLIQLSAIEKITQCFSQLVDALNNATIHENTLYLTVVQYQSSKGTAVRKLSGIFHGLLFEVHFGIKTLNS